MDKIKIIIVGTGDFVIRIIDRIYNGIEFELLGVILDESIDEQYVESFKKALISKQINVLTLDEKIISEADIIFTCEYRRAIPKKFVEKFLFVNMHAGILPKYKGFSANPWAIMNGETEIGYSIHKVEKEFDTGDIYYVGKFEIEEHQTYSQIHKKILDDVEKKIGWILSSIINGNLKRQSQDEIGVYCTKFNAQMGDLKSFDCDARYIFNLYRCMAKPHGTGVYFLYKDKKFYPYKVTPGYSIGIKDYLGISGKIVNCRENEIWVKTKDNVIILEDIHYENGDRIAEKFFTIGNKLGK